MDEIKLSLADPVVWGKCPKCTASYPGKKVGDYFAKAYPRRKEDKTQPDGLRTAADVLASQTCENCGTPMQFLYEVK